MLHKLITLSLNKDGELSRFERDNLYETLAHRFAPFGCEGLKKNRLNQVAYYRGKDWFLQTFTTPEGEAAATKHLYRSIIE
jgi:hypothetical protein